MPLPLLPLQILYLNIVNDVFPALALGLGEGDETQMRARPRPADEPILSSRLWWATLAWGALVAGPVLGAFWIARDGLGYDRLEAMTVAFLAISITRLWHVFNMRSAGSGLLSNDVVRNPWIWGAIGLCLALLLAALYLPGISTVLRTRLPDLRGWVVILGASVVPLVLGQAWIALASRLGIDETKARAKDESCTEG